MLCQLRARRYFCVLGGNDTVAAGRFCERRQDGVLSFIPTRLGDASACLPRSQDPVTTGKHLNGKAPELGQTLDPKGAERRGLGSRISGSDVMKKFCILGDGTDVGQTNWKQQAEQITVLAKCSGGEQKIRAPTGEGEDSGLWTEVGSNCFSPN